MTRAVAILALIATAVAAVQTWRVERTQARAEAAEAMVSAYEEAARMRRDQDARQAALRAEAQAMDHELAQGEGADAPLSDYLSGAAGRLWP
ncbi:hypothetical protein [Pseudogemmobacter sonorensis]|uniref:hypothetical protein n=1 Tax=Pseudogemmobacter sonorensis TaxID=2989681 RepID=UPI00368A5D6C